MYSEAVPATGGAGGWAGNVWRGCARVRGEPGSADPLLPVSGKRVRVEGCARCLLLVAVARRSLLVLPLYTGIRCIPLCRCAFAAYRCCR